MAWKIGEALKLTKGIAQGMPFIRGAAAQGLKPTESYRSFKEAGFKGRYQNFLDAFRASKYALQNPAAYMPGGLDDPLQKEFIPLNPSRQNRIYRYTVSAEVWSDDHGGVIRNTLTIDSDDILTAREAIEVYDEYTTEYEGILGANAINYKIESVTYTDNPFYKSL